MPLSEAPWTFLGRRRKRAAPFGESDDLRLAIAFTDDDYRLGVRPVGVGEVLRPRTIAMPAASKNPGSTSAWSAMKGPWSAGSLNPSTLKSLELWLSGFRCGLLMAPTASTPGSARKRSEEASRVDACLVGREPGLRRQEGQQGGRLAAEARVGRLHPPKAAREQFGADQQHQRDRQLRDDQRVAPLELTGLAVPGVFASEGAGHVRPGALQRRHQAEQDAGHD